MAAHRYWRLLIHAGTRIAHSMAEVQFRTAPGVSLPFSGGTASASTEFDVLYAAPKAADGDTETLWAAATDHEGEWWSYDYGSGNSRDITEVTLTSRNDASYYDQTPASFDVQYSDDASAWTTPPGGAFTTTWTGPLQTQVFTFGTVAPTAGLMKAWSGSAWAEKPVKVWTGSAWATKPLRRWDGSKWVPTLAAPTGPTTTILNSYSPPFDRNDYTGEVGVQITFASTQTVSWVGIRKAPTVTGMQTVKIYTWSPYTLLRTIPIDVSGVADNIYKWTSMTSLAMTGGVAYAIMYQATNGGQMWGEYGPVSYKQPPVSTAFGAYNSGTPGLATQDSSYVGIDLGW